MPCKPRCVVCKSTGENRKLFGFPTKQERFVLWAEHLNIDITGLTPRTFLSKGARVCSEHFEDRHFSNATKEKLNRNAVPIPLQDDDSDTDGDSDEDINSDDADIDSDPEEPPSSEESPSPLPDVDLNESPTKKRKANGSVDRLNESLVECIDKLTESAAPVKDAKLFADFVASRIAQIESENEKRAFRLQHEILELIIKTEKELLDH